jgi:hypothetical protein
MSIEFTKPAEAFAAVAAVAIGTDGVGSIEERDALFGPVRELEVFAGSSETDFRALLGDVTGRVYSQLPMEGTAFGQEAIDQLVAASKAVLSAQQQEDACRMAAKLCVSDGQGAGEVGLINRLRAGFGLA